jgi:hypothetical protein
LFGARGRWSPVTREIIALPCALAIGLLREALHLTLRHSAGD